MVGAFIKARREAGSGNAEDFLKYIEEIYGDLNRVDKALS